jgi:hypothetical protein
MIDMQTYRQLHEEKELDSSAHQDNLNPDQMESDTPPNEEFLLQLPSKILGFGLYDKKWSELLACSSPVYRLIRNGRVSSRRVYTEDNTVEQNCLQPSRVGSRQEAATHGNGEGTYRLRHICRHH